MLSIEPSLIRLMPRHIDKSVIDIFRIYNFLQVDLRLFKSFRISYTSLTFWGIATRIYFTRYILHRVHLHLHRNKLIPNPFMKTWI